MDIVNGLIQAIQEFNIEEAIYWAHLILQRQKQQQQTLSVPIDQLFIGLGLGDTVLSSLLCSLIWETVKNEDYPVIIENYRKELLQGLNESIDENVQKLCLRIVFEMSNGMEIDQEIFNCSLNLLVKSNYSVSSYLITLILNLKLNQPNLLNTLVGIYSTTTRSDSVVQFRFLELFSKLNLEQSVGLKTAFFNELREIFNGNAGDSLLIANGLQIIQDCIYGRSQFLMFQSEGIIEIIIKLLDSSATIPAIKSKAIDLLANFALLNCFGYDFIASNGLDRKILTSDESLRESCVFCTAAFSTISEDPKNLLVSFPDHLVHGTSSVQLAALHGLGIFFKTHSEVNTNNPKIQILLYLTENCNFFDFLVERTNSTFDEQKSAAYFVLKSIVSTEECLKLVLDTTILISNLLDRTLDNSQVGLKWKYGIFEQIYSNSNLFSCFNDTLKEQVTKYLGQGVTFVPKSTRVAFESAD